MIQEPNSTTHRRKAQLLERTAAAAARRQAAAIQPAQADGLRRQLLRAGGRAALYEHERNPA